MRKARFQRPPLPPAPCTDCGTPTDEPRRGLCIGCYLRVRRGAAFDLGACCQVCRNNDRRVLRWHKLGGAMVVLCANHSAIAGRRPLELEELRAECA